MSTLSEIFEGVCDFYQVDKAECLQSSRKRKYVKPRQIYAAIAKENTRASLSVIGELIKKDHATVLYSHRTVMDEIETNKEYRDEYNKLISYLGIRNPNDKKAMTNIYTNEAQTILHVTVLQKIVSSHRFIAFKGDEDFENVSACSKCCFDAIKCEGVPCTGEERKDKQSGYFETIE